MPDLLDGQTAEVWGSGAKPYQLKNVGGVYSCSCPAWRNQSSAPASTSASIAARRLKWPVSAAPWSQRQRQKTSSQLRRFCSLRLGVQKPIHAVGGYQKSSTACGPFGLVESFSRATEISTRPLSGSSWDCPARRWMASYGSVASSSNAPSRSCGAATGPTCGARSGIWCSMPRR